jgi:GT2 family glycosyltransferase
VISVIVYGRNDAHGYNLHRRAALSLNCIAEVLDDPDDEVVFVDYNTPDELPTFVEALSDTLTERCLRLLRVLRVSAAVHERRFAARTHLAVVEPVARNAGVRRANPSNRWLLLTNTDMVLLPRSERSLSEICSEVSDGFYGLPRFELPEWLWERLPRSDPAFAMAEIKRLGEGLRLNEPTLSSEWIRFDAPGDFQLVLREDFVAIDGLDEEMLLGYHVDSNFSKRMRLHRGSIESLAERLAGYHCNHNRTPTVYHGSRVVTNDLERFFLSVDRPELAAQRRTWGLVDEMLEEVLIRERSGGQFAAAVRAASPTNAGPRQPSDAARIPFELTYDSAHVMPFIADSLAVTPPKATIGYLGANPVLERSLAALVAQLGEGRSLAAPKLDDPSAIDDVAERAEVFIVDLGLDESLVDTPPPAARNHQPDELPARLARTFVAFERLVELERARLELGEHARRFVLVHSWTVFWDAYVLAHLDCSHTTAHSRVRRATVRPQPVADEATNALLTREDRLMRWAARGDLGRPRLSVRPGQELELADLDDYGGFGGGWTYPDERGLWTQGRRSELALALDGNGHGDHVVALSIESVCVAPDATLSVEMLIDSERAASRDFRYGDAEWYVQLPARMLSDGQFDLTFEVEEPGSPVELGWSEDDERRLGLLLRSVTLLAPDDEAARAGLGRERRRARWAARDEVGQRPLHVRLHEAVDLADVDDYSAFGDGWVLYPDQAGVWTEGSRSQLALKLEGIGESDYTLVLSLGSICVDGDASLRLEALVNGERASARDFSFGDPEWRIASPSASPRDGNVDLTFIIEEPRSPRAVGWSADERPLGVLVRAIAVEDADRSVRPGEKIIFSEGSDTGRLLCDGWSRLEPTGVWTDGDEASLLLRLTDAPPIDAELILGVTPFVAPDHRELRVGFSALGEQLASQVFRHGNADRLVRIPLPAAARGHAARMRFELRLHDPARPVDLGLSGDERLLGLHLQWLMVGKINRLEMLWRALRAKAGALRRRLA